MLRNFMWTRKPDYSKISQIDYDEYWRVRGFKLNTKLKEREELILNLIKPNSKIMDIGCGNTLLPVKLKEAGHNIKVADISEVVLEGYKKHSIEGKKINIDKTDDLKIEEHFDYIILSEVLEHLVNPEKVIKKLEEHTKFFVITIPNSAFYHYRVHLFFRGRFFTQWVYHPSEHLRFWSHVDFVDWLKSMGLEIVKIKAANGLSIGPFDLSNVWKNLFAHQIVYICRTEKNN